jgi:hypothetical protein
MANHCAHCRQTDLEVELNTYRCLNCGEATDMKGRPRPKQVRFTAPSFQERREAGEVQ